MREKRKRRTNKNEERSGEGGKEVKKARKQTRNEERESE
jgi:hypothetical protein